MMGKTSKGGSKSSLHHIYKDKARNRIDDLQGMFKDIQVARNESRTDDVIFLEEQVNQMLSQWKDELNEPTPASSQNEGSLSSFSSDILRLLQPLEDDATSGLGLLTSPKPETEINTQSIQVGNQWDLYEDYFLNQTQLEQKSPETEQLKGSFFGHNLMEMSTPLDYQQYNVGHDIDHNFLIDSDGTPLTGESSGDQISSLVCTVDSPAFLGPKCALWDCSRPAKGLEGCQDYCDNFHLYLASEESLPGRAPIMRCGGIDLVDGHIFAALKTKAQGKVVGIPECEGAATMKCPWNSPELFDLSCFGGETLREWLYFDKPRSGNRKQRSLPDHSGRGWHESTKKQIMKEFDGQKRSYLMEPQPLYNYKWHLYVYEINNNDVCALYRLELKLVEEKKSPKGKVVADSVAEFPAVDSQSFKVGENNFLNDVQHTPGPAYMPPTNESSFYEDNFVNLTVQEHGSLGFDHYKSSPSEMQYLLTDSLEVANQLDYHHFETHRVFGNNNSIGFAGSGQCDTSDLQPSACHASSPFTRPKCALWDCLRPAHGSEYCRNFHVCLALAEGAQSTVPILRPGGISLKDGPLFASLRAKLRGTDVGIPVCEGAATMKSPWNDPGLQSLLAFNIAEHFNISLAEGETIREWLFFDKPRKAFESGNRKQRLLPDYKGRWHGSRNKAIQEFGGIKKSYYMDPQPEEFVGWHLYEYEIDNHDTLTLFRLELKIVDKKKSPKGKVTKVSISDLQKQMGRLTAEVPADIDLSVTNKK
ncbi:Transcription factor voz1 [Thalictrum thalictroides]|uniref:Transcription factor voz1 n=1 Tax=Thalictrum thalictroides TaxID=46969 RepID=A0A7J6UZR1_THATH|nr:Transcription factor voz1 [Thalictrum thalictroides]